MLWIVLYDLLPVLGGGVVKGDSFLFLFQKCDTIVGVRNGSVDERDLLINESLHNEFEHRILKAYHLLFPHISDHQMDEMLHTWLSYCGVSDRKKEVYLVSE